MELVLLDGRNSNLHIHIQNHNFFLVITKCYTEILLTFLK